MRHKYVNSMITGCCVICKQDRNDAEKHFDTRHEKAERSAPLSDEHPMPQRMAAMEEEKAEILKDQKRRNGDRIDRARKLAAHIYAETQQPVMVWQVHDRWKRDVEQELSWKDDAGKTYWAGAIFTKREWQCVGMGKSPLNHNDSNKKWEPKA